MWNLSNRMAAWGAFLFVDFRNGFHISITARRTLLLLLSPKNAKIHALLRAIFAPEPDRTPPIEIAHNDPVRLALSVRDLVNANDLGPGLTSPLDLLAHVLHLECLDGFPIE